MKTIEIVAKDGMWHLTGTFMGVRVRRTTGLPAEKRLYAEAQKAKTFCETEIINGTYGPKQPTRTVLAAVNDYLNLHHSKMKGGYLTIRDFAKKHGQMKMSAVTTALVQRYVEDKFSNNNQPGWRVKSSTLHTETAPLRRLFTMEYEAGYLKKPIKLALPPRGEGRSLFLTLEQATAVMDNEPKFCAPIFTFLLTTGARFQEAIRLDWKDVDLIKGEVVLMTYKGKDRRPKHRRVPMPQRTIDALTALPHRSGHVFMNSWGRPYKYKSGNSAVTHHWRILRKKLGCPNIALHDLRHTYASHLAMSGVDIRRLAELLGHENLNRTRQYAHLLPSVLHEAVDKLPYGRSSNNNGQKSDEVTS
jgi:integrase